MMMDDQLLTLSHDPTQLAIGRIDQYTGAWAVHVPHFEALLQQVSRMDLASHVATFEPNANESYLGYSLSGGIAVVSLAGTMTKGGSSLSTAGSTVRARRAIRNAEADAEVKAIMLHIESPGGTVAGTKELADDVRAVTKPTATYFEDIGASAAYWVGSQADDVFANEAALVGSIGTYMAIADFSQYAEQNGIKVHVIRAGEFKGAGVPGTQITDTQIEHWQGLINQINDLFTSAISTSRGIKNLARIADGRVHIAADAATMGLIDEVRTLDDAMAHLRARAAVNDGRTRMSEQTTETKAATLAELEMRFPKASADWMLGQLKVSATMEDAQAAWQAEVEQELAQAQEDLVQAEARAVKAEEAKKAQPPGNKGVGSAPVSSDANESYAYVLNAFRQAVNEEADKHLATANVSPMHARAKAMRNVRAQHPDWAEILDKGM